MFQLEKSEVRLSMDTAINKLSYTCEHYEQQNTKDSKTLIYVNLLNY